MATVKCDKCGKDLETVGLNRTYPPKKDDTGQVICPHCGHAHGPGVSGSSAKITYTNIPFPGGEA